MEDQFSLLSLPFFFQDEGQGFEELKQSLLCTTLELENTIVCAHEEIAKKDQEILNLKNLLARTAKERNEAMEECHFLRQQLNLQFHGGTLTAASSEDQQTLSSSDSEENNNVVFNVSRCTQDSPPPPPPAAVEVTDKVAPKMPLPEKGKFLQAVMEAGPLLQTLLLAGPLPEWQHPPPQLNSVDIPPVTISPSVSSSATTTTQRLLHQDSALSATGGKGYFSKKRTNGACDSPSPSKYQKVDQISLTTNIISAN